jgi:hypothetical protein
MATYPYPYPSYDWAYQGFDYAYPPQLDSSVVAQMYDDGVRFIGRYLFNDRYPNGKGISASEAQLYLDAGIAIFLYYEVGAGDALGGYEAGYNNGIACLAEANFIGVPIGTQIYCCCDMDVSDAQAYGVVMDYLNGFKDALPDYNVGIYGGLNVMQASYSTYPDTLRVQAGIYGNEFEPINIKQWQIGSNRRASADGKIRISGITIDNNGYAYYRGHSVDLCSTDNLTNMWGHDTPTPPTPSGHKMPIWFYLKLF